MKSTEQVEILHWAKTKHQVDVKKVCRDLNTTDLESLCKLLQKTKQISSVIDPKKVVSEFLEEHSIEYIPQTFNGIEVDLHRLFQTHPLLEGDYIEVSLNHILLNSWCRDTRENYRELKKHLKGLGFEIVERISVHSKTLEKEAFVRLKSGYELSLPKTLKSYVSPINWISDISSWIYQDQPNITLYGEAYKVRNVGSRWLAYFTRRFIELFEMSEIEYLYKHPQIRGCYENAPPVKVLCDLTIRDVFKPTPLKIWIDQVLKHTDLTLYEQGSDTESGRVFLEAIYDEVCGKLSKTMIHNSGISDLKQVQGWISIMVISYVNDILEGYRGLI